MVKWFKNKFYFLAASYFRFFAKIRLKAWRPKIVVITGSNGKTTLLHLVESQLKEQAKFSHKANSSFGIPFDILGLKRESFKPLEWLKLFLAAPFGSQKKPYSQKIYIVEADCDRVGEGKFLAEFLKPEIVFWVSLSKTHSMNFEYLVRRGKFKTLEEAIGFEFGYFLQYASELAVINGDEPNIVNQSSRSHAKIESVSKQELSRYQVLENGTEFEIDKTAYNFKSLLPKESFYAVAMAVKLLKFLGAGNSLNFQDFVLPPGRSSVFSGVKNTRIIDSSYNANLQSMAAVLDLFEAYPAQIKWAVLGDMLEQGQSEGGEHEKLAKLVGQYKFDRIILMGKRVCEHTYPKLLPLIGEDRVIKFEKPKEALDYILANLQGGETLLFKGARFMEGIIEHLLEDKNDIEKLCRREPIWQERRKKWNL